MSVINILIYFSPTISGLFIIRFSEMKFFPYIQIGLIEKVPFKTTPSNHLIVLEELRKSE